MDKVKETTRKRLKLPSVTAWMLCAVVCLLTVIFVFPVLIKQSQSESTFKFFGDAVWALLPVPFAITAALIVSQKPGNIIGWLLMMPVFIAIFSTPFNNYTFTLLPPSNPDFFLLFVIWFSNWDWLALIFPLLLIALLFPTGQPPSQRWRWVLILAAGLCVYFLFLSTFTKEMQPSNVNWTVSNPIGFLDSATVEALFAPWPVGLATITISCVVSLFVRYRRAARIERQQIKWLLYAGGIFALIYIPGIWINSSSSADNSFSADLFNFLFSLAILTFPGAITFAILQYRLWDIDIIIRRTLIYTVLTAILALFYFGCVLALQQIFRSLTGNTSPIALVISTLAIAALFAPVRKRLQNFIDRRFYRQKYDTARILTAFSAAARDEVELSELTDQLLTVASKAMQPASIFLWLKPIAKAKPNPIENSPKI